MSAKDEWISAAAGTTKITDASARLKRLIIPQTAALGAAITVLSATLAGTDALGITRFEIPSGFDPTEQHVWDFGDGILVKDRLEFAHGTEAFWIQFDTSI